MGGRSIPVTGSRPLISCPAAAKTTCIAVIESFVGGSIWLNFSRAVALNVESFNS